MKKIILALLITMMAATLAAADTIYMRDGKTVRGTVLGFVNGRFAVRLTSLGTVPARPVDDRAQPASDVNLPNTSGDIVFLRPRDIERIEIDGRSL